MRTLIIIAALVALTRSASASPDEPTALDVAGAPAPGDESGLVESVDPGDSTSRRIARGVLFGPRLLVDALYFPIRIGVGAFERYQLAERAKRLFFNDAMTIGLFPTVKRESGFGLTFGARFVHRDLFGAGEKLGVQSGFGGRFQQLHKLSLKSGDRFDDRLAVELDAEYERRPGEPFYALGNQDDVRAEYRHQVARSTLVADVRAISDLHVRASGALADHEIEGTGEMDSIDQIYPVDAMTAGTGARDVYGELELRWDSRRRADAWEPAALAGTGTLAAVFAGRSHSLTGGADYWRYGVDLQQFIHLDVGPRVLILRAHAEAVNDGADVPFYHLPRLGGTTYLRGYAAERFRDRIAAVVSADYQFDLSRNLSARLFVDGGRVYSSTNDLNVDNMRVGYGIGLDITTESSFLARASLASSIDGGVFFNFALDPAFELDRRIER